MQAKAIAYCARRTNSKARKTTESLLAVKQRIMARLYGKTVRTLLSLAIRAGPAIATSACLLRSCSQDRNQMSENGTRVRESARHDTRNGLREQSRRTIGWIWTGRERTVR